MLTLSNFCLSDWNADVERYYSNPYDAESYINLNKDISMESYIRTQTAPYPGPGTIKENSLQNYPFPNKNERKEIYFKLTAQGTYIDEHAHELASIGSVKIPAEDASPSDAKTYYLFGTLVQGTKTTSTAQKNIPTQDYNSAGE